MTSKGCLSVATAPTRPDSQIRPIAKSLVARPKPPLIVGRYALFDEIASGGAASVHIGRLLGAFGFSRTVAVKRLHQESALDPEFIALFSDEARLTARIRHPNVVPTLDVVTLGDELLLVMEYVSGAALSRILREERGMGRTVPRRIAVDIMIGVLNGLHAAHEATGENGEPLHIVHRDVSPQNILVGIDGIARVLDFGIAKAVGGLHHSVPHQIKGKFRYLSPETVTAQPVTRASDIYSASAVLWEMLAGRRLFDDKNNAEILLKILREPLRPPSHLCPHISRELDDIVMRGLNRDPAQRFPTARAMALALEAEVAAVTRSTVSAWVSASVGGEIRERDALAARIEREVLVELDPSALVVQEPSETANIGPQPGRFVSTLNRAIDSLQSRRWSRPVAIAAIACLATLLWLHFHRKAPEPPAMRSLPRREATSSVSSAHVESAPAPTVAVPVLPLEELSVRTGAPAPTAELPPTVHKSSRHKRPKSRPAQPAIKSPPAPRVFSDRLYQRD